MKQITKKDITDASTIADVYNMHPELFKEKGILSSHGGFVSVVLLREVLTDLMQEGKSVEVPIVGFSMIEKAFEGILKEGDV